MRPREVPRGAFLYEVDAKLRFGVLSVKDL